MATRIDGDVARGVVAAINNDREGRVSEEDARRLRTTGLDKIRGSKRPETTFRATSLGIDAALKLPMTDATRGYLSRYAVAGETVAKARRQELDSGSVAPALSARVNQALVNSFGLTGGVELTASTVQAGKTFVDLGQITAIGELSARVELTEDDQGQPVIGSVQLKTRPSLIDPTLRSSLESALLGAGLHDPAIEAAAAAPGGGWLVLARSSTGTSAHKVISAPGGPNVTPFVPDEETLKALALPLAAQRGLDLAKNIGPSAELEVYLRAGQRTAADLELISDPDDGPGFNPGELQVAAYSVLGDSAVYVTSNPVTGGYRVDDVN